MDMTIQTRLTLSHLAVTLISFFIFATLILAGVYYARVTDSAQAVGDIAFNSAQLLAIRATEQSALDEQVAGDFIASRFPDVFTTSEANVGSQADEGTIEIDNDAVPTIRLNEGFILDLNRILYELVLWKPIWGAGSREWVIVMDPQGTIVGSNYLAQYPIGSQIQENLPPGFNGLWLTDIPTMTDAQLANEWVDFDIIDGRHYIGQAAIISPTNTLLGWIYYRADGQSIQSLLWRLVVLVGMGALIAAGIALVASGIVGSLLARSFSRRLHAITVVSTEFAKGNWDMRLETKGNDEVAQLARHFNRLADRFGHYLREVRTLADRNALLAEEAQSLARVEERSRLARELHDGVKQRLFGLSLTAGSIPPLLRHEPDVALERVQQLAQQVHAIQEEMDHIVLQLRPASLADKGLVPAIQELVDNWTSETEIPIAFSVIGERELPVAIEQTFYRVVQEALNNVARHAYATQVELSLTYGLSSESLNQDSLDQVELQVVDDGRGFDPLADRPVRSLGLDSMRGRVEEAGGQLEIISRPGEGTRIVARIQG